MRDAASPNSSWEIARLQELRSYAILDTPRDGAFDDITYLVSRYFNAPIAIVSIVDSDRIWFKSTQGIGDIAQIERGPGLCASAILQEGVYVAPDLRKDPNSMTNPLVAEKHGLRFYAAAPLKTRNGYNLGTLCILDAAPRDFSESEADDLKRFSGLVMTQIEQLMVGRELATLSNDVADQNVSLLQAVIRDPLTGLHNRAAAEQFLEELQNDIDQGFQSTVLVLDVDHFKSINDNFGHHVGDTVLVEIARRLQRLIRPSDRLIRLGGEEFLVILRRCTHGMAGEIARRLRDAIAQRPIEVDDLELSVTLSGGLCHSSSRSEVELMVRKADAALYEAKNHGRARIVAASATG